MIPIPAETRILGMTTSATVKFWCRVEMPRSPWNRFWTYFRYWMWTGRS